MKELIGPGDLPHTFRFIEPLESHLAARFEDAEAGCQTFRSVLLVNLSQI